VSRLFGYVTAPDGELPVVTETSYSDVPADSSLAYYVETLTDEGFYEDELADGIFRPGENISGGDIAELLSNATGEDVEVEDSYASASGMTRGGFLDLVLSLFE
jgi:hypothetical protein